MRCLLVVAAAAGVLALPTAAHAFGESAITAPADPSRIVVTDGSPAVLVEGTVTAPVLGDKVDIVCLTGSSALGIPATEVDAETGSFSVSVPAFSLFRGVCRMHAIPSGADMTTLDLSKYTGPLVTADMDREYRTPPADASSNVPNDFLVTHAQPRGWSNLYSLGSCGLCSLHLFYADTTSSSESVFRANGWFFHEEDDRNRSYLRIDGRNAVTSMGASDIDVDPGAGVAKGSTLTGVPPMTHTTTRAAGTDMTLVEDQDLVACEGPAPTWPPSAAACGKWVPTGVHSRHTVRQEREGTLVRIEDVFSSTDGAEHALDLHWDQFFGNPPGAASPAFRFPWAGDAYSPHVEGDTIDPPPGAPFTIFVDTNDQAPDGDRLWPQGAMVFDQPAGRPEFFLPQEFVLPMTATVPAGGSITFRHAYAAGTTVAEVAEVARGVEDEWRGPVVPIAAPGGDPPAAPTPPAPLTPRDVTAPVVSRLALTNTTFAVARGATPIAAAARRGTRVRYTLSEPATVTFAISRARPGRRVAGRCRRPTRANRGRRRCTRYVKVGRTIRRASPAGRSTLRFTGRIGRRALRPGRHRMAVAATDGAGNSSRARRLRFRIVRR